MLERHRGRVGVLGCGSGVRGAYLRLVGAVRGDVSALECSADARHGECGR